MALLAIQTVSLTGLNPTYVAAAGGGDTFDNPNGRTFFHVKNGGAGSINVTLNSVSNCNQGFDHDVVVAVPAAGERMIGLYDVARFNSAGLVSTTYSGVTSVTVAAITV